MTSTTRRYALMSINDVAKFLSVSRSTVYRLIRDGKLAPYTQLRSGSRTYKRFRWEDVEKFAESNLIFNIE